MKIVNLVVLMLLAVSAVGAVTMHTDLAPGMPPLPAPGTTIPLDASAVFDMGTGLWTYTYVIDPSNAVLPITGFSVANVNHYIFYDAANNKNFVNPTWENLPSSVYWMGGNVPQNAGPIIFSFTSPLGPTVVNCTLHGGTKVAVGETLGMIPEPVSLLAIGTLLTGGAIAVRRRRK